MDAGSATRKALHLVRRGHKKAAARLLHQVLSENPRNEHAWWILAGIADSPADIKGCLEKVLAINPDNLQAQKFLRELDQARPRSKKPSSLVRVFLPVTALILFIPMLTVLFFASRQNQKQSSFAQTCTATIPPATRVISSTPRIQPSSTPFPTEIPSPTGTVSPGFPEEKQISNITGQRMRISLDCESNAAVIFAGYYGVEIDEVGFFINLPVSDNPDKGFVGDVHDEWGNIPPDGYGIYPGPVATQLQKYGVAAAAVENFTLNGILAQIAADNPVIVWVIGRVERGKASLYTSSDGESNLVARYQHTVIVIGYDQEGVTILDGDRIYSRSYEQFMSSWNVLGNMAIIRSQD